MVPLLLKTTESEGIQTLFPYLKDLGSFEETIVAGLHFQLSLFVSCAGPD